jgi:hypothetical protein
LAVRAIAQTFVARPVMRLAQAAGLYTRNLILGQWKQRLAPISQTKSTSQSAPF